MVMGIQVGKGSAACCGGYRWKGGLERLWRATERGVSFFTQMSLSQHCEGYGTPKPALAAICLNSSDHKQQYTLSSSYSNFYLFGAAEKRKEKWGGDRRKRTISVKGKGGTGAEPKRKALESKAFCSYYWRQKSLL